MKTTKLRAVITAGVAFATLIGISLFTAARRTVGDDQRILSEGTCGYCLIGFDALDVPVVPSADGNRLNGGAASGVLRSAPVRRSFQDLFPDGKRELFTRFPREFTVAISADAPRRFLLQETLVTRDHTTWVARSSGAPATMLIATTANGGIDVVHHVEGGEEHFISVRGSDAVVSWMADDFTCGAIEAHVDDGFTGSRQQGHTASSLSQEAEVNYADILFLYDADALAVASQSAADGDGKRVILSMARLHTEATNRALERSGVVNFRWRAVDAVQMTHYTRTGYMLDDLMQITTTSLTLNAAQ